MMHCVKLSGSDKNRPIGQLPVYPAVGYATRVKRVFISGLGVVSPVGLGRDRFWSALMSGESGVAPVTRFDTSGLDRNLGCEVKAFHPRDFMTALEARRMGRCSQMALAAARMAVDEAGIESSLSGSDRTAVIVGTTMGEANVLDELEHAWIHDGDSAVTVAKLPRYGSTLLPIHIARAFGARGVVQTLPAACAAGNYAIGLAADLIRSGRADVAITGASEVMAKLEYAGFARLGAMAPQRCQPFDVDRRGLILGEGAGMLVIESEEHLVRRGGKALAEVGGYGLACDAHHITRPHPDGAGSKTAMRDALRSTGITAADVDFINAHGTGTPANDPIESQVIREIFGEDTWVSSIKSMIGHCMGAASAIEAVSCVLSLEHSILPPTINYETPDPHCSVSLVANEPREVTVDVVMNNALAFGGYDGVVCLARPGVLPSPQEAA